MGSENTHGCTQNTEKASAFVYFLERYQKDGNGFLNHIVPVRADETWVSFGNVKTKEQ
jgi:hypothetical protein